MNWPFPVHNYEMPPVPLPVKMLEIQIHSQIQIHSHSYNLATKTWSHHNKKAPEVDAYAL